MGDALTALPSVALVESIHGPMTRPCDVCRGGWWENDEMLVAVHHNACPRKDECEEGGDRDS